MRSRSPIFSSTTCAAAMHSRTSPTDRACPPTYLIATRYTRCGARSCCGSNQESFFLDRQLIAGDDFSGALIVPLNQLAMRDVLAADLPYLKIEECFEYEFARAKKEDLLPRFRGSVLWADRAVAELWNWPALERLLGPFSLYYMYLRSNIETEIIYYRLFRSVICRHRPQGSRVVWNGALTRGSWRGLAQIVDRPRGSAASVGATGRIQRSRRTQRLAKRRPAPASAQATASRLKAKLIGEMKRLAIVHRRKRVIAEEVEDKLPAQALFLQTRVGTILLLAVFRSSRGRYKADSPYSSERSRWRGRTAARYKRACFNAFSVRSKCSMRYWAPMLGRS